MISFFPWSEKLFFFKYLLKAKMLHFYDLNIHYKIVISIVCDYHNNLLLNDFSYRLKKKITENK